MALTIPSPRTTSVLTAQTVPKPSATHAASSTKGYAFPTHSAEESCVVVTVTVTKTSGTAVAPHPTAPIGTGVPPAPSVTKSHSAPPAYYTGAASAMKVPAGVAGVLGFAALLL